jgi:hypothetical protein
MSSKPSYIQPPRRIFWILGVASLLTGLALFAGGLSLSGNEAWRMLGLVMIGLGGVGTGIGGRVLVSCWIGLRKSQQSA